MKTKDPIPSFENGKYENIFTQRCHAENAEASRKMRPYGAIRTE